jgi:serine/threonine protein kinase
MARRSHSSRATEEQPGLDKVPTVEEFLKTVVRSNLIERQELKSTLESFPHAQRHDAQALADHLVRAGKLSRFQARKLLLGVSRGLIFGPYQILSMIGKGGMGRVFLTRDSRTGQLRALKVLPPSKARSKERLLARFQREMELSQKVAHPHLCRTFEVGQLHGVYYLAMEFIPGQSLSRLVKTYGPLTVPRAARLLAEVASGLHSAHQQGLVHRDLKPGNIMITPHDHAKVLDLGLALMEGEKSDDPTITGGQGYVVGTMDYIAPEQTHDATAVDARADIYALGCTLYYALTGRPPFPGGTSLEKIQRQRNEQPDSLLELLPTLPPGFAAIVRQMMHKDPKKRFASAREVAEKLWPWAGSAPEQPIDQEDDPAYVAAIETLRQEEPPPDSSWTDMDLDTLETRTPQADEEDKGGVPVERLLTWTLIGLGLAVCVTALVAGLVQVARLIGR